MPQSTFRLKTLSIVESKEQLAALPGGKLLINTINAHSYNTALGDPLFAQALMGGGALIPDGISIVKACRWLRAKSQPRERIAGWDLFEHEMARLAARPQGSGRRAVVMFMGSSEHVLSLIRRRMEADYPSLRCVTYSPPYKPQFTDADNRAIVEAINAAAPDLLWIGMTAPKQEKWAYSHWGELHIDCHVGTVGAVFDFFAGTVERAPLWWQRHGLEWLYRLLREPRRMWRRYVIGNAKLLFNIAFKEALG